MDYLFSLLSFHLHPRGTTFKGHLAWRPVTDDRIWVSWRVANFTGGQLPRAATLAVVREKEEEKRPQFNLLNRVNLFPRIYDVNDRDVRDSPSPNTARSGVERRMWSWIDAGGSMSQPSR